MSLIASISGIRGTIGGTPGDNLTPPDVVRFVAAYAHWLKQQGVVARVVLGRDARPSGPMVHALAMATLVSCGVEVIDIGLTTTPTAEMAVVMADAGGGIILTASHNPKQWNALKLLNFRGEFLSGDDGAAILALYQSQDFHFAPVDELGTVRSEPDYYLKEHIEAILALPHVNGEAIAQAGFRVVVDGINSSGAIAIPQLLTALGVTDVTVLNAEPNGQFAHNPEPLKEHLVETCAAVKTSGAHIGVVVDPDVDRLAFIDERGEMFGEEYTLVAVADYLLQFGAGHLVSNLSSSRALREVAEARGGTYSAAAVGEVNVVTEMKAHKAILGGEGNGGIIYPDLHYGRDALVGVAFMLSHLATSGKSVSALRAGYPAWFMSKQKVQFPPKQSAEAILEALEAHYLKTVPNVHIDKRDGVKLDLPESWIHLRRSNTEPILRVYTEARTQAEADTLANEVVTLADAIMAGL
jgi:phosphomannomutase